MSEVADQSQVSNHSKAHIVSQRLTIGAYRFSFKVEEIAEDQAIELHRGWSMVDVRAGDFDQDEDLWRDALASHIRLICLTFNSSAGKILIEDAVRKHERFAKQMQGKPAVADPLAS